METSYFIFGIDRIYFFPTFTSQFQWLEFMLGSFYFFTYLFPYTKWQLVWVIDLRLKAFYPLDYHVFNILFPACTQGYDSTSS